MSTFRLRVGLVALALLLATIFSTTLMAQDEDPTPEPTATTESTEAVEPTATPGGDTDNETPDGTNDTTDETTPEPVGITADGTVTIGGSGIGAIALEAIINASNVEIVTDIQRTGTNEGVRAFCASEIDGTLTNRPLSELEGSTCEANGVAFTELMIGHDIIAVITNPDVEFADCLTQNELTQVFAPSASGELTNWGQLGLAYPQQTLRTFATTPNTLSGARLDSLVDGVGIRSDAGVRGTDSEVISAVAETSGAIGVVTLTALDGIDTVNIVALDNPALVACYDPSAATVEDRSYIGGNRLFLYLNTASLENEAGLSDLLAFIGTDEAQTAIAEAGFTPLTEDAGLRLSGVIADGEIGRSFSQEVTAFTIPPSVSGRVNVGGVAHMQGYVDSIRQQFNAQFPSVPIDGFFEGEFAGFRDFCNGELDILFTSGVPTEAQLENCTANNITSETFNLGAQATVLIANADDDYLACLTPAQVATIWSAAPEDQLPTTWNTISDAFPETNIILVASPLGDIFTDIMIANAAGQAVPRRVDVAEANTNALYRAAAVANVTGALTYMSWSDYQDVLEEGQEGIQLVRVGEDCATAAEPSNETIISGDYPLSRPIGVTVSIPSMANLPVQSVMWYIFTDQNYPFLETSAGLLSLPFGELPGIRETLEGLFVAAEEQAAQLPETGVDATDETPTNAPDSEDTGDEASTDETTSEGDAENSTEDEAGDATDEADESATETPSDDESGDGDDSEDATPEAEDGE